MHCVILTINHPAFDFAAEIAVILNYHNIHTEVYFVFRSLVHRNRSLG
jgi:hypothetical protein